MTRRTLAVMTAVLLAPLAAQAHFPFLHLKTENARPTVHVYFAETAAPDDPALLDHIKDAKVWRLTPDGSPEPLALTKTAESLTAEAPPSKPATYGLTKEYGVLSRGSDSFQLMYYAKTFSGRDAWTIATAEHLALDIVPQQDGDELVLTVLWQGAPLPNAEVVVQGGLESLEGETDAAGRYRCTLPDPELYSIRAKHVEEASGESAGKSYDSRRHYATLTLDLKK